MNPRSSREDILEQNALASLDAIPLDVTRRFAQRSFRFMEAYAQASIGQSFHDLHPSDIASEMFEDNELKPNKPLMMVNDVQTNRQAIDLRSLQQESPEDITEEQGLFGLELFSESSDEQLESRHRGSTRKSEEEEELSVLCVGKNKGNDLKPLLSEGTATNMEAAVDQLSLLVKSTPDGHPDKPGYLHILGTSHQIRFERLGEMADIDKAIEAQHKPVILVNFGNSYQMRYESLGEISDINKAIELQHQAIGLTPDDHPNKPAILNNLGISQARRFECSGEVADINKAIESQLQAVNLTLDSHPDKPGQLNNLGNMQMRLFEQLGDMTSIDKAIDNLGNAHTRRFESFGEIINIHRAIDLQRQAVNLTLDGHRDKPMYLSSLGNSQMRRFECLGEIADIAVAIESHHCAVSLTSDGHLNKPNYLNNLGNSHVTRFKHVGEMADIKMAIESQCQALNLIPIGRPNRPLVLSNLGCSHKTLFECLGEKADIDKAIELQSKAVNLTPDGHPDKPMYLSNLGNSQMRQFERFGDIFNIEMAIVSLLEAVNLAPDGHPNKPNYLNNLGTSHVKRFEHLGKMADIDMAIESQLQAVKLTPDSHPDKPMYLNSLGNSQGRRFERLGETMDIDMASESHRQAVNLTPDGHPNKPSYLNNLGTSHHTQFERFGKIADLDRAIESLHQAINLTPDNQPKDFVRLGNLGISHLTRFKHLGDITDIDKAIQLQLQATDLASDGDTRKPMHLGSLGNSYQARFERLGEVFDIEKAIELQLQAVNLAPDGHPDKPRYFNNLGVSHRIQFEHFDEATDIDKAIELQRRAVSLTPDGHPDKPGRLDDIGTSHQTRFERLGEMADIDKAIEVHRQAVTLIPDGHPNMPIYLNNLGNSQGRRFNRLKEMVDIDMSIQSQCQAVKLTPDGHPDKPAFLKNLGTSYQMRFECFGDMGDIDKAIINFEQCAMSVVGPPIDRFSAAVAWISGLRRKEKISAFRSQNLQPQRTLINLIPELVWLGATVRRRFQTIHDVVGSSIHEAVSAAIRSQELELAVEWMEQGRSIVWSQLRRLRSPLVDLQEAHPILAQEFQDIQQKIETFFLRREVQDKTQTEPDSLEQQAQSHRHDIQKREELLTEIRGKHGFESFLRPEKFSALSKSCQGHLVALLTVSEENCDALVILPCSSITHLSFPNVSLSHINDLHIQWETSRVARLSNRGDEGLMPPNMNHLLHAQKDISPETHLSSRGEGPALLNIDPMLSLLSDLWEKIVHPIIQVDRRLWDAAEDRLPRIIWCPAGPLSFLPFHAAGIYSSNSEERISISDFAVSSYTPSLMALLSSSARLGRPSILIVTQPNTPNQKPLPGTLREADKIMQKAALNDMGPYIHHLSQGQATVSAVIEQLKNHGWVHFACHGAQKLPDPMESSFALDDGHLTLASLMQNSIKQAQFAFLSACQTATGSQTLPDEAMHLVSGMLAAGFPSVVGTMWSIEDRMVPEVAEAFYAILFEEGHQSKWTGETRTCLCTSLCSEKS
ncbi:TPR-like protein [Flagelloscypha sp. PMI_526]|nr:TPR-like protein [Flagelloscypha sp. PMI_526]